MASTRVIVPPDVLRRIAADAARAVPGVVRLAGPPNARAGRDGDESGITMHNGAANLRVDCSIIAQQETSLLELGLAVQIAVAEALREIAGATVREVNVYIQDIHNPAT